MGCTGNANSEKNYIIAEAIIRENNEDDEQEYQIINSYEQMERDGQLDQIKGDEELDKQRLENNNEKEIKTTKIKINDEEIPFSYTYAFKKPGKYTIKYIFPQLLTRIDYMFYRCTVLNKIDFTNFNAKLVTNMEELFNNSYAETINLSNINTKNVTNMRGMFCDCNNLTNLNLSKFDTRNVTNMDRMFQRCEALKTLDLSSFKTEKVTSMIGMFEGCEDLANLNISGFKIKDKENIIAIFSGCPNLKKNNIIANDPKIFEEFDRQREKEDEEGEGEEEGYPEAVE